MTRLMLLGLGLGLAATSMVTLGIPFAFADEAATASDAAAVTKVEASATGSKKVLPASKFFGAAQEGYLYAAKCPELLEKVFCYCGCDYADGHMSLLDCFSTDHGADCPICVDEAKTVFSLKLQGKNLHEIQLAVDRKFSALRDNSIPTTPQLIKYRAQMKLLKSAPTAGKKTATAPSPASPASPKSAVFDTATADLPVSMAGRGKIGSCCGHHQN